MKLIDGGFYSNLPYKIAIEEGAEEIWALHIKGKRENYSKIKILNILNLSIEYLLNLKIEEQKRFLNKKVKTHYIELNHPEELSIFDFSKTKKLIDLGYEIALNYIKNRL